MPFLDKFNYTRKDNSDRSCYEVPRYTPQITKSFKWSVERLVVYEADNQIITTNTEEQHHEF